MRYNGLNCWFNGQEGLPGLYAYCLSALYKSLKKPTIFSPKLSWSTRSGQLFILIHPMTLTGALSVPWDPPNTVLWEIIFAVSYFSFFIGLSHLRVSSQSYSLCARSSNMHKTYLFSANHARYVHVHATYAHILCDWLETCRWDKIYLIISLMVNMSCPFSAHISWPCTYFAWLAENMWDDIYWIIGSVVKGLPLFVYIYEMTMHIFFMIGWKHVGEIRWTEFLV